MKLTDEKQLPATAKFEKFLIRENLLFPESGLIGECVWANHNAPHIINSPKHITALEVAKKMHEMLGEYEHGGATTMRECTAYREAVDPITPWDASEEAEDEEKANCMEEALLNVFRASCEDIVLMMLNS